MADLTSEINEMMGQSCYAIPDDVDEADLMNELDALEEDMAAEPAMGADSGPSYLQVREWARGAVCQPHHTLETPGTPECAGGRTCREGAALRRHLAALLTSLPIMPCALTRRSRTCQSCPQPHSSRRQRRSWGCLPHPRCALERAGRMRDLCLRSIAMYSNEVMLHRTPYVVQQSPPGSMGWRDEIELKPHTRSPALQGPQILCSPSCMRCGADARNEAP
jgi:hypothetical protein